MRYFRKVVLATPVMFHGKPVPWEIISLSTGVRELNEQSDAELISELDKLADARRGGVTRISAEIFASSKKNRTSPQSRNPQTAFDKLRVSPDRESVALITPKAAPAPSASAVPPANNPPPAPAVPGLARFAGMDKPIGAIRVPEPGSAAAPQSPKPLAKPTVRKASQAKVQKIKAPAPAQSPPPTPPPPSGESKQAA